MHCLAKPLAFALCLFLTNPNAEAQELVGARVEPSEVVVSGRSVRVAVDFRTSQSADGSSDENWRCGLSVDFGDGTRSFHRVEGNRAPLMLSHTYSTPGHYAVTLDGKSHFQGFTASTVFACSGRARTVTIVVRPDESAVREAAERAAQQENVLRRATEDRQAAERAAEAARVQRLSAERAPKKSAKDRATAERQTTKQSRPIQDQKASPKTSEGKSSERSDVKPIAPAPTRARSAIDL